MIAQIEERRSRPANLDLAERFTFTRSARSRRRSVRRKARLEQGDRLPEFLPSSLESSGEPILNVPAWKRISDCAWLVCSLPLAIPLIFLVALWVRLVSRGPALLRQERIGLGGRKFTLYKFRSMYHGAPTIDHERHVGRLVESDSPMVKLDLLGDSRLIPGGCFLRTAGLDELPQLLNVLRGEMSLVGPRPCLPGEFGFFDATQRKRFAVLPGLTGLWQVNGKNRATFKQMNSMDLAYGRAMSLGLDLKIILRTPMALLRQIGECMASRRLNRGASRRVVVPKDSLLGYATQRLSDRS